MARRWIAPAALGAALCICSTTAYAQSDAERAGARAAAIEGHKAFQEGRWQDVIDLFDRAESLVHAPPHLLFLARANEKLGRLVEAREHYMKVIKENIAPDAPRAFHDSQTSARDELAALEPRMPSVNIAVTGLEKGMKFEVKVDGEPIPSVLIGLPMPINPGAHKFEAVAEGFSATEIEATFTEGRKDKVVLEMKKDPNAVLPGAAVPAEEAAQPAGQPQDPGAPPPADAPPPEEGGGSGMRIGGYIALGVGAVGVGMGLGMGLKSQNRRAEIDDLCPDPSECRADREYVLDLNDQAGSAQTLAIVGFALGGVGIATGVTLLVLGGKSGGGDEVSSTEGVQLQPWVGLGSAGLNGRF